MKFGFVYIMGVNNQPFVKVGVSKEPFKRMKFLANGFGIKIEECWFFVSSLKKDPYSIERRCHKELSKYRCGGFGPEKLYPRETFKCGIEKARTLLDTIVRTHQAKRPEIQQ